MSKIKLGIIGTGNMAQFHAEGFAEIRGVEMVACYDVDESAAKAFGAKHEFETVAESAEQVIESCDAICVVTPDRFHAENTLAALAEGKHLLCEKPLTVTLDEARDVAKAAEKAGRRGAIHMVHFSYRNSAAFQRAMKLVADGKLGEIRFVSGKYLQHWLSANTSGNWKDPSMVWRLQTSSGSGGTLGDIGCHILDFVSAIAGDIQSARCSLSTFPKVDLKTGKKITEIDGKKLDANDTALIEVNLRNGATGQIHATRWASGHPNQVAMGVYGTEGAIEIDLEAGFHVLRTCMGPARHKHEWKEQDLKPTPSLYQKFIRSIKTGRNDQPDLVRGAQVQAYLDACERSAKSGKTEEVAKWL